MSTRITVNRNGSLRVQGEDFEIVDINGNTFGLGGRTTVSLCRCGASASMPFCDGTHRAIGFKSNSQAFDLPAKSE